jgi:hypothetical protein
MGSEMRDGPQHEASIGTPDLEVGDVGVADVGQKG